MSRRAKRRIVWIVAGGSLLVLTLALGLNADALRVRWYLSRLESSDPVVRGEAVDALDARLDPELLPALLRSTLRWPVKEPHGPPRLPRVGEYDPLEASARLRPLLDDESPRVRAGVLVILADLRGDLMATTVESLASQEPLVRQQAVRRIERLGVPEDSVLLAISNLLRAPSDATELDTTLAALKTSLPPAATTTHVLELARSGRVDPSRAEQVLRAVLVRPATLALATARLRLGQAGPLGPLAREGAFVAAELTEICTAARGAPTETRVALLVGLADAVSPNTDLEDRCRQDLIEFLGDGHPLVRSAAAASLAVGSTFWIFDPRRVSAARRWLEVATKTPRLEGSESLKGFVLPLLGDLAASLYAPLVNARFAEGEPPRPGDLPRLTRDRERACCRELLACPTREVRAWARARLETLEEAPLDLDRSREILASEFSGVDELLDAAEWLVEESISDDETLAALRAAYLRAAGFPHAIGLREALDRLDAHSEATRAIEPVGTREDGLEPMVDRASVRRLLAALRRGETIGEDRAATVDGLAVEGPQATEYAPALAEILVRSEKGSMLRRRAARSLALAGVETAASARQLARALEEPALAEPESRRALLGALRELGPDARLASHEICACLGDLDHRVRLEAVRVLGELAPDDADVVSAIARSLDDSHPNVRAASVLALGDLVGDFPRYRDAALEASLGRCLEDRDERVRKASERTLKRWHGVVPRRAPSTGE